MRFLAHRLPIVFLGVGSLIALVMGCGRVREEEPNDGLGSGGGYQQTVPCHLDPGYCPGDDEDPDTQETPTGSGGSSNVASGGSSGDEELGMAGSPTIAYEPEINTSGSFHLHGEGLMVSSGESGPATYYTVVTLPENTLVEATLDDVQLRTGVAGSLTFLLEGCEPVESDTEVCQLTVTSFGGSPSGSPEVDAPLDLRLGGFESQVYYVASAVRRGDTWSAQIQPEGMDLRVYRWDGAVIEERYKEGELYFMRVEEETAYHYALTITAIEVSCSLEECSLSLSAGAQ